MADQDLVIEAVTAMVDAVNRGDIGSALACFAGDAHVVEDIAPFRWHGPSAATDWLAAMAANAATLGVSAIVMELGRAQRIEIAGDSAYLVIAGALRMMAEDNALCAEGLLTFTLGRKGDRWLIDSLGWAGPRPAAC